jgi:citrate synthase
MDIELDNCIAARTVLSDVDGEAGRLIIRGHDLEELAARYSYEETLLVLWSGIVKTRYAERDGLVLALGRERSMAFKRQRQLLKNAPKLVEAELVRYLISAEPAIDAIAAPLASVAAVGVAAALASRHSRGLPLVAPDETASHGFDLLRMLRGEAPEPAEAKAFDTYLVTAIDHGLNASTFAARVVASTRASMQSSITAAFCALMGPLHGGAPGPVLDMMDAIAASGNAPAWIATELASGRRLMGFGHRIYRVRDPRADVLKTALTTLGQTTRLALAEEIERAALAALGAHKAQRRLDVNTEFYTALLLDRLKIPRGAFTPVFAASRVAGWVAHICEQEATGRLIRPRSEYIGARPKEAA